MHNCYGDELGLTSDDEDYIDPYENAADESTTHNSTAKSTDSVSEVCGRIYIFLGFYHLLIIDNKHMCE